MRTIISKSGLRARNFAGFLQQLQIAAGVGERAGFFVGIRGGQYNIGHQRGLGEEHVLHDDESSWRRRRDRHSNGRRDSSRRRTAPSTCRPSAASIMPRQIEAGASAECSAPLLVEVAVAGDRGDSREAGRDRGPCRPRRASWRNRRGRRTSRQELKNRRRPGLRYRCRESRSRR